MALKVHNLETLYVAQLKDAYSAETQLINALPKMIKHAQSDELRQALESHLAETKEQKKRIDTIFESLDYKPTGETCNAMKGLIEEADELVEEHVSDSDTVDAAIVCASNKVEHYEIATYGTLLRYAESMGRTKDAGLLETTLNEEKEADTKLTKLACAQLNAEAKATA